MNIIACLAESQIGNSREKRGFGLVERPTSCQQFCQDNPRRGEAAMVMKSPLFEIKGRSTIELDVLAVGVQGKLFRPKFPELPSAPTMALGHFDWLD